jgi:ribulose-phosphate 3-epimerase
MKGVKIAPSILSCDFLNLGKEIKAVEAAGVDLIHIDVMDGHFVPNITIGPMFVEAIKAIATKPLDVHLMIEQPDRYAGDFVKAGADIVTVHAEADHHILRTLDEIRLKGAKAGVSLNPGTPLNALDHLMDAVDLILIMTVNPGFGGQGYIAAMDQKIEKARAMITRSRQNVELEVDGGIKATNVLRVTKAGAGIVVMGTEIFHSGDYRKKVSEIRAKLEG